MTKNSSNSIFCSHEQLEKFVNKVCIWNLTFMGRPLTGKLLEVTDECVLIEMRDGRTLVARLDCVVGFGMAKHQPERSGEPDEKAVHAETV
jgi:hypothetical protein